MKIRYANVVWTKVSDHGLGPVNYVSVIQTNTQFTLKKVSEYDQEIPQLHSADQRTET